MSGSYVALRFLFLRKGTFNLSNAKRVAEELVAAATDKELEDLRTFSYLFPSAESREDILNDIHRLLDDLAASLDSDDVDTLSFGNIVMYGTGGLLHSSSGDDPTEAYGTWDIVLGDDVHVPEAWGKALFDACGFIPPDDLTITVR